jgi:hypothetical protein
VKVALVFCDDVRDYTAPVMGLAMKKLSLLALVAAVAAAISMHAIIRAEGQLVAGRNINLHPGVDDEFTGDRFLQRQLEPKIVCAIPQHCVAIANDYRTVDATSDLLSGFGEGTATLNALQALNRFFGIKTNRAALPDAWLGLYRTTNLENWQNGVVPGFPQGINSLDLDQPWHGLAAASDGDVATDGAHFYGTGMFFNRGGASMIGAFRLTDFNDESAVPIRWDQGFSRVIDQRNVPSTVQFLDLPAIAVDPTPRAGNAPGCGNVYVGYTAFTGTNGDSSINLVKSSNCGVSYSKPIRISGSFKKNQRVVFAVDPRPGTPLTTGGGTLYAVWRTFSPDMIVGTASFDFGKTWVPAVPYSVLNGVNTLCTYDQPTIGSDNDLAQPANDTARAVAFPTIAIASNGTIYLAWAERVNAAGKPVLGSACNSTLTPRIVVTSSSTRGLTWTVRQAIDIGARCETVAGDNRPGGLDRSIPNGTAAACPANTVGRASGPQIQPVLSHNAGKLMLMYSEGRGALTSSPGSPANGYHSGRDSRMDVRAARLNPASGALISTTQASVYTYDVMTNDIKTVDGATNPPGAKAVNRPYLLQYKGGTTPFKGDHDGLAPAEPVVWDSPAHFPTPADVPGTRFIGIWGGDTRESLFPGGDLFNGNWREYIFPGCNAGIRNSNDYASSIGSTTEAFVNQSFKPVGTLQRTWVVTVRNRSDFGRAYKFELEEVAGNGSFDQLEDVNVIGTDPQNPFCANASAGCRAYRVILPNSSMTFTVFGTISSQTVGGPIRVRVSEATLNASSTEVSSTALAAIVRLNPNPNNPSPTIAGAGTANSEVHGPSVDGPFVSTHGSPTPGNPTPGNPTPGNATLGFPTPGNPTPGNPTPGNAGFSDYTDYQYQVRATDANTSSQYAAFANIAFADQVDRSHLVQMIITRPHGVPTLGASSPGCPEMERADDELVSIITAPTPGNLAVPTPGNPTPGNPTPGNPTPGNTTTTNPTPGNPTPGNNTFAVAPANAPLVGLGASAMFRATAVAGAQAAVVSPQAANLGPDGTLVKILGTDFVTVTVRFWHCEKDGGCSLNGRLYEKDTVETVPKEPGDAANNLIGFSTAPGAGDNTDNVITPPQAVTRGRDLSIVAGAFTATPSSVSPGGQTTVSQFTIANTGNLDAGPFSYRYFLVPGEGTPIALTDSIPVPTPGELGISIAAGGFLGIPARELTIPASAALGSYRIRVVIDDTNAIFESNEFNNSKDTPFTVVEGLIAVWADGQPTDGNNGVVAFINSLPGYSATIVSTSDLETPGFLNAFRALYVTRVGANIPGTSLSAVAAANVQTYVGSGPVVLFMNDWVDNLPTATTGDPSDPNTSALIAAAVRRAASRHGYVGEYNGAAMALTANANLFIPLNLIAGSAGLLGAIPCRPVTITAAGSVIQGSVATSFTPIDPSCFGGAASGVAAGNIWANYTTIGAIGQIAIIGR